MAVAMAAFAAHRARGRWLRRSEGDRSGLTGDGSCVIAMGVPRAWLAARSSGDRLEEEVDAMQTVFIKFSTQDDRVRGFYLATKARIGSSRAKSTRCPSRLALLDNQQIAYRHGSDLLSLVANASTASRSSRSRSS